VVVVCSGVYSIHTTITSCVVVVLFARSHFDMPGHTIHVYIKWRHSFLFFSLSLLFFLYLFRISKWEISRMRRRESGEVLHNPTRVFYLSSSSSPAPTHKSPSREETTTTKSLSSHLFCLWFLICLAGQTNLNFYLKKKKNWNVVQSEEYKSHCVDCFLNVFFYFCLTLSWVEWGGGVITGRPCTYWSSLPRLLLLLLRCI
jgi:hypothetical protein